jgi:hypothetical protein
VEVVAVAVVVSALVLPDDVGAAAVVVSALVLPLVEVVAAAVVASALVLPDDVGAAAVVASVVPETVAVAAVASVVPEVVVVAAVVAAVGSVVGVVVAGVGVALMSVTACPLSSVVGGGRLTTRRALSVKPVVSEVPRCSKRELRRVSHCFRSRSLGHLDE